MEYYNTALQYYSTVQYLEKSYATHAATNCPVTPPIRFFSFFYFNSFGVKKFQNILLGQEKENFQKIPLPLIRICQFFHPFASCAFLNIAPATKCFESNWEEESRFYKHSTKVHIFISLKTRRS